MSMLNNVVGYWAYYIFGGLIFKLAYIRGGGAYIWNEVSVQPSKTVKIEVGKKGPT